MKNGIKKYLSGKKNIILTVFCICLTVILILYGFFGMEEKNPDKNAVSKAQVAKSVSLLFHNMNYIKEIENTNFKNDGKWYVKYINTMYKDGYFDRTFVKPDEKSSMSAFTYKDLDKMFTNIGVADKELLSYVKNNKSSDVIETGQWNKIYSVMVEKFGKEKDIKKVTGTIVATISNVPTMKQWKAATSEGMLGYEGLSVDYFIDREVEMLVKDGEILCVSKIINKDVNYENAWIISMTAGNLKAYIGGAVREFTCHDKTTNLSNVIADIELKDKKVRTVKPKNDTVTGKVLSASAEEVEIEGLGKFKVSDRCRVYKVYGTMDMGSINDVLVGYDVQKFVIKDQVIQAVVIDRDVLASNIRVLIMDTGFKSIYHDSVTVKAESGMKIWYNNNTEYFQVPPSQEYTFSPDMELFSMGRIKITTIGVGDKINLTTIERAYGKPSYRGEFELSIADGKIVIVNELPLEQYLYSVVPSEMPWGYSYEALKAQAICARSFAYIELKNNRYSRFGAHVDDSTNFQVYNNSEEHPSTTEAVDDTYGRVIKSNGEVISAYFFSTSCGATTDSSIWSEKLPYTESVLLSDSGEQIDLSEEKKFSSFIRTNFDTYDSEYPWYRWNFTLSLKQITESINSKISTISADCLQVVKDDGTLENCAVDSVGDVKKIETGERGAGGVLKYITVYGSQKVVRIYKELNIRRIFDLTGVEIHRGNGSVTDSMSSLPSGFFVMDAVSEDNIITGYSFVGGGYGHGVGMSQNGADYLGKTGKTCEDIINIFYNQVSVEKLY